MRIPVTGAPTRVDSSSMGSAADESITLHAEGGAIRVHGGHHEDEEGDFTAADGLLVPQGGYYSVDLRRYESLWVNSADGTSEFDVTAVKLNSPEVA